MRHSHEGPRRSCRITSLYTVLILGLHPWCGTIMKYKRSVQCCVVVVQIVQCCVVVVQKKAGI
jgi:hypothetical protein